MKKLLDLTHNTAMPPTGGIRCGKAAFIKALRAARPRPSAGWRIGYRSLLLALAWFTVLFSPLAGWALVNTDIYQRDQHFDRDAITIKAGDQLTMKNADTVKHNIVIINQAGDSDDKGIQKPGEDIIAVFTTPGYYKVRCNIHSTMKLNVTVQ